MFSIYPDLIQFLQDDLAMSASAIEFALKRSGDFEPLLDRPVKTELSLDK